MKTTSTINNNNGFNQSINTTKKSHKYHQNYDQITENINRNATIAQLEYERNACEEELYRLRYGIENLLANNDQGDYKIQQRFRHPYRDRKNYSWFDRCSPCCRRWRRHRDDNHTIISNESTYHHHMYRDRNYHISPHRTSESPYQSLPHRFDIYIRRYLITSEYIFSDSFVSTSPSPYNEPYMSRRRSDLRHSIDNLMNRNTSIHKTNISKEINDPVYNSLIVKILETKALDCLCSGYSKQNAQQQIAKELSKINQRLLIL